MILHNTVIVSPPDSKGRLTVSGALVVDSGFHGQPKLVLRNSDVEIELGFRPLSASASFISGE